jgi:hypothetical protein
MAARALVNQNVFGLTSEMIKEEYRVSKQTAERILSLLKNCQWRPARSHDPAPLGYSSPSSIVEIAHKVMYKRGFVAK